MFFSLSQYSSTLLFCTSNVKNVALQFTHNVFLQVSLCLCCNGVRSNYMHGHNESAIVNGSVQWQI
jgi:hypothetical protein